MAGVRRSSHKVPGAWCLVPGPDEGRCSRGEARGSWGEVPLAALWRASAGRGSQSQSLKRDRVLLESSNGVCSCALLPVILLT